MNHTDAAFANSPKGVQIISAHIFLGMTFYLCIEVVVRLLLRCTRLSLYFWAFFIGILAIAVCSIVLIIGNFSFTGTVVVLTHLSWWTFKFAQSIVLYSRLDLVMSNRHILRYVLWTIIFTAVVVGLPTTVTAIIWGFMNINSKPPVKISKANSIFDKVQLAVLFTQETAIGLLYIYATVKYLKNRVSLGADRKATRRVLHYLIAVNTFIICLECTRLGMFYTELEYARLRECYTVAVYAVKLRTEFTVLNQLKSTLVRQDGCGTRPSDATDLPRIDAELGAEGHRSQGSGIQLVDRTGIEKKVVFTMTSHEDLMESDGISSTK